MVQSHLYGDIELAQCKVRKTNKDIVTGQKGNPYMSFDEDSAIIHRMATLGICVLDPTRTMSLIPAVLQG